jgi:hypothetical protein
MTPYLLSMRSAESADVRCGKVRQAGPSEPGAVRLEETTWMDEEGGFEPATNEGTGALKTLRRPAERRWETLCRRLWGVEPLHLCIS